MYWNLISKCVGNYCPQKFLFCPTEVLLDSRIQRDLLCWDRIQIILLVEFAHGICCLDVAIRGDGRTISYITYMCALVNSGMSLGVVAFS